MKKKFWNVFKNPLALPVCALALMLAVNVAITPHFFKISINNGVLYGYLVDILNRSSELVILAVGMTLVVAASRGTDISVGAVMAVTGAIVVRLLGSSYERYATPPVLAILAGLLGAASCGAFNGFLVSRLNIQPMVATLILYTAGRGIAQLVSSNESATGVILYVRRESFRFIGGFIPGCIVPTPIFIAAFFAALAFFVLKKPRSTPTFRPSASTQRRDGLLESTRLWWCSSAMSFARFRRAWRGR